MSQVLTNLLAEVESLNSLDELFTLQERIISRIRTITAPNGNGNVHTSAQVVLERMERNQAHIPGTYQRSQEEIEALSARLKAKLSPSEQEQLDKVDLSKLNFSGKSMSQMLIEERQEERY
jgi:hypothetical protein